MATLYPSKLRDLQCQVITTRYDEFNVRHMMQIKSYASNPNGSPQTHDFTLEFEISEDELKLWYETNETHLAMVHGRLEIRFGDIDIKSESE